MTRHRVVFAARALAQLNALQSFIGAASSASVASAFVDRLIDRCLTLEAFPLRGTPREDIGPGIRTIPFKRRATIAYTVAGTDVVIVTIAYRGQDIHTMMHDAD